MESLWRGATSRFTGKIALRLRFRRCNGKTRISRNEAHLTNSPAELVNIDILLLSTSTARTCRPLGENLMLKQLFKKPSDVPDSPNERRSAPLHVHVSYVGVHDYTTVMVLNRTS